MKCYNCGRTLSEDDFCTACGADVKMYKQILFLADAFYNEGLAKARVRDLSGAAASLRDSLKCNKRHVKARNLLGLVYFEMGETVAALSEWLISLDIRPKKNVASDFMKSVQSNPARLNLLDQSIKKYNQGLSYAHRGDLDLAKIQLKKVVSMNQNYIRAFELLTLLFLNDEEWDRAKHTAERALRVDSNNTKLLSYLQEANRQLSLKDAASGRKGRKQKEESFTYQSGNETIIQPLNGPDKAGRFSILYIILGLVLGIGIMWFLVVPSRIKEGRSDVNEQIKRVSEELTTRNAEMEDMTRKLEALEKEKQAREQELESFTGESGVIGNYDNLLKAAESYITDPEDALTAAGYLEAIGNPEDFNEEFGVLYGLLSEHVSAKAAETYFKSGTDKYNDGDYAGAIEDLTRVVDLDSENDEALYYLAQAYDKSEDKDKATEYFHQLVDNFPKSTYRDKARKYLDQGESDDSEAGSGTAAPAAPAQTAPAAPAVPAPVVTPTQAQEAAALQAAMEAAAAAAAAATAGQQ